MCVWLCLHYKQNYPEKRDVWETKVLLSSDLYSVSTSYNSTYK